MAPSAIRSEAISSGLLQQDDREKSLPATRRSHSREATPMARKAKIETTSESPVFKSDMTSIRDLVTCTICDQLLYEPWTLSCGHTYCYSCLCSWFVPNRRKKTCPECRAAIKVMPAPAFLVKQTVEIFCKRSELMDPDESIEQHNAKRAEEIADVDKDRNSPEGLFKGTFKSSPQLVFDPMDGVHRCPHCHHEYEGGPTCSQCGLDVEHDDENSDSDLDDGLGLNEFEITQNGHHNPFLAHTDGIPHFPINAGHLNHPHYHHHFGHDHDSQGETSDSDLDNSDDDEDEGSLQDFIDHDEHDREVTHLNNMPINISDDESDEGGEVSNTRGLFRRRFLRTVSTTPSSPSILTVTTDSENGDPPDDAETLRTAGWSPLEPEDESENEVQRHPYIHQPGYESTEDGHDSEGGSDTNTMRNGPTDDDDSDDRDQTPSVDYGMNHYSRYGYTESEDDNSEINFPPVMDRDGDTEMSVSPGPSVSTGFDYDDDNDCDLFGDEEDQGTPRAIRGEGNSTDYGEHLGEASEVHEVEDEESSDEDIQPSRRRPRQHYAQVQQDPRMIRMLNNHQQSTSPLEAIAEADLVFESASRRRATAYRHPLRRADSMRSSRSPSANRFISSSSRFTRPPRQYQRRI